MECTITCVRRMDPNQQNTKRGGIDERRCLCVRSEVAKLRAKLSDVTQELQELLSSHNQKLQSESARTDRMRRQRDFSEEQLDRERRRNDRADRPDPRPEEGFNRRRDPDNYN